MNRAGDVGLLGLLVVQPLMYWVVFGLQSDYFWWFVAVLHAMPIVNVPVFFVGLGKSAKRLIAKEPLDPIVALQVGFSLLDIVLIALRSDTLAGPWA